MITFDDVMKVEIQVGLVLSAEKIPATDKLLKLSVDFGTILKHEAKPEANKTDMIEVNDIRQVVSGIAIAFLDPTVLVGKKFIFVTNLEPRKIKSFESQAMILASGEGEGLTLFTPLKDVPPGSHLK